MKFEVIDSMIVITKEVSSNWWNFVFDKGTPTLDVLW
jgi:hypothetical protein